MSSSSLSPFIQHIPDCKKRMRKLRKKIYKHKVNQNQSDKKQINKSQDISSILMNIFQKRNIPSSIITSIKNKRNIDIFNLKSLVIGMQPHLRWDRQTLKQKTNNQQQQIQKIYKQHCQRMKQVKRNSNNQQSVLKMIRRNYISSTQIDYDSHQDSSSILNSNSHYNSQQNNSNHNQDSHNQSSQQNSMFQNYLSKQTPSKEQIQAFIQVGQKQSSYYHQGQNFFNF